MEPDGDVLLPWRVIPAALAAGALTSADVVRSGVQVDQVGRSHAVYRISVGGEVRFFVKCFGPRRGATDGTAARELAVLRLADERPAVAALTPCRWPWEHPPGGPSQVVATEAVHGAEAWTLDHPGGGDRTIDEAWAALVAALVPPLAAFHRATRDLARPGAAIPAGLEPEQPWGLRLMDGDAPPELWATPSTALLLNEAATDALLIAGLRDARALWRPLALVHTDLKHDNVLVATDPDGLRIRVLDWEMARIGDLAWDLAGLTARLVLAREVKPPWSEADVVAAALLLGDYAAATGLRVPALARRLVLYTGAVLTMMSLQHASTVPPGTDPAPARRLMTQARVTFARAAQLTTALIDRAEARTA